MHLKVRFLILSIESDIYVFFKILTEIPIKSNVDKIYMILLFLNIVFQLSRYLYGFIELDEYFLSVIEN